MLRISRIVVRRGLTLLLLAAAAAAAGILLRAAELARACLPSLLRSICCCCDRDRVVCRTRSIWRQIWLYAVVCGPCFGCCRLSWACWLCALGRLMSTSARQSSSAVSPTRISASPSLSTSSSTTAAASANPCEYSALHCSVGWLNRN